jgi:hypothetical protein
MKPFYTIADGKTIARGAKSGMHSFCMEGQPETVKFGFCECGNSVKMQDDRS